MTSYIKSCERFIKRNPGLDAEDMEEYIKVRAIRLCEHRGIDPHGETTTAPEPSSNGMQLGVAIICENWQVAANEIAAFMEVRDAIQECDEDDNERLRSTIQDMMDAIAEGGNSDD
jgi:hypothetical protein